MCVSTCRGNGRMVMFPPGSGRANGCEAVVYLPPVFPYRHQSEPPCTEMQHWARGRLQGARTEHILASSNLCLVLLLLGSLGEVLPELFLYGFLLQFDERKYLEIFTMERKDALAVGSTLLRGSGKPLELSKVKLCSVQIWDQMCFINLNSLKIGHLQMAYVFFMDQNIKLTRTSIPSY